MVERPAEKLSVGQTFLKTKLAELDGFRSDPRFWQIGFAPGGRYSEWFVSLKEKRTAQDFTFDERIGAGELQQMGLEYMHRRGEETEFTRSARPRVMTVILP